MKMLHNLQIISKLAVTIPLTTIEAFRFDSENFLFHRLHHECKEDWPNLISRRQFNAWRKLTVRLAEDIRKEVAISIYSSEDVFCIDSKPVKVCQNARAKRCAMG
ncbi:MAG: IS982 family transposase, partial [Muribaculaceae bacterium]|nr:IS982 family transposase [Muribaculaceae bacterium]